MDDDKTAMERPATKLAILLLVLGILIAGAVWLVCSAEPGNPPILLPDGSSLRLLDVTEGTNHVYGSMLVKVLSRLPMKVARPLLKRLPNGGRLNSRTTSRPSLVVWVEYTDAGAGTRRSGTAMLRTPGGRPSGRDAFLSFRAAPGAAKSIYPMEFSNWPRRDAYIECVIYERDQDHDHVEVGSFRFRNPTVFEGSAWTPDPPATTKTDGDLEVTLLDFAAGLGSSSSYAAGPEGRHRKIYRSSKDADRPTRALIRVAFNSPRGTNEQWGMFDADLSDVTGNQLGATSRSGMTGNMVFGPLLWPDEAAWRVKIHLKRKSGFAPGELLVLSNVAIPEVGTTNLINQTNVIRGVETVLRSFMRRPNLMNRQSWSSSDLSEFRMEHPDLGATNQLDLVHIVAQPAGTNLNTGGSSWSDTYHEFSIRHIPTNATHLDLTFSVQEPRFVEFTVPPNWVTNDYVLEPE